MEQPLTQTVPADRVAASTDAFARPKNSRFVLPRFLRAVLMGLLFFFFFVGSPVIALVFFPFIRLTAGEGFRDRATHLLHRGMWFIGRAAWALGLVDLDLPAMPPGIDPAKPYVLISNHPTYIDMIVILGTFANLTCVTNGRWWKHWALGRLLRATNYLPGPGSGLPESDEMLTSMVAHLKVHPLLVFPEGQRSLPDRLRRFRRGAVEAAVRAHVPIVPLFLAIDQPYLTKNVPVWRPAKRPLKYTFEWFDPIDPAAFGFDGKQIQQHLDALYQARFRVQRGALAAA